MFSRHRFAKENCKPLGYRFTGQVAIAVVRALAHASRMAYEEHAALIGLIYRQYRQTLPRHIFRVCKGGAALPTGNRQS